MSDSPEQPGLDPEEVKTFTSRKLEWMDGVSIDPDLAPHDFQVGFIIAQCISAEKGIGTIADATIAQRTGTRREHVAKSRKKLRERGWLDWTNTRTANIYRLKFDLVERMIDLRITYREQRDEARFARLPSRRDVKSSAQQEQHVVRSSAHHNDDAVRSTSQHVVNSSAQHVVRSSAHIHPQCSTLDIHPKKEGLSKKETLVVRGEEPEQEIITGEIDELTEAISTSVDIPAAAAGAVLSNTLDKTEARADLPVIESLAEMSDASDKPMGNAFPEMSGAPDKSEGPSIGGPCEGQAVDVPHEAQTVQRAAQIAIEQPLPPPLSEPLAEMKLFDELGEGDPDRGCRIATAIGDARFTYLRRELMRGTLYRSAIRSAARGIRLEAA